MRAYPEASTIRLRVGARHACARQPGGRRNSLTTLGPAPVFTTAATAAGSSSPKRKVVLTFKQSFRKTSRVARQAHGVHEATLVRSRRQHRPRIATESDTGSPGPVTDGGTPTGAPPALHFPIPMCPWSSSLVRDGIPSPQDSPFTCSPGFSAGSPAGDCAPSLAPPSRRGSLVVPLCPADGLAELDTLAG